MKFTIEIADELVQPLADLTGVEPTENAFANYYSRSIAASLAGQIVSKDFEGALNSKTAELEGKIKPDQK